MARARLLLPSMITALLLSTPNLQAAGGDQQLIEDLRTLAQEARQRNAADRWLQRSLDDLVARYDNPWQQAILFEDFGDGDFTRNPSWQVMTGQFQVIRGQGLSSSVGAYNNAYGNGYNNNYPQQQAAPAQTPEGALSSMIVGALLGNALGPNNQQGASAPAPAPTQAPAYPSGPNQIRLQANVSNAFSMITTLRTGGQQGARFDITLQQSEQASYGYRLRVDTGARPIIELERLRGGRGAIVESQPLNVALGDGRFHDIAWQQAPDGTVTVKVDDQAVFQVRDRAFRDAYPWLVLNHESGDLTVRALRIDGV